MTNALSTAPAACARCGTELSALALACPHCGALVHRDRLHALAELAGAAASNGDHAAVRAHWQEALALLPPRSQQHQQITARLHALTETIQKGERSAPAATPPGEQGHSWWKRGLGAALAVGLLLASKLKLLLFGLSKLSTLVSMFGFIAVYWSIHGWPLAVGIAASIYVHEMGHVAMLRRLGIAAGAPLFIPGVGALVMLKEHVTDPVVDARIGLAGPVWGLSAAAVAWALYFATAAPIWRALAELTGFLNLFNLIPIWQLDGSRGFHALSRSERWMAIAAIALTLAATGVRLLWILGAVAIFRAVRGQQGPGHRPTLATFVVLVVTLSWFARAVR